MFIIVKKQQIFIHLSVLLVVFQCITIISRYKKYNVNFVKGYLINCCCRQFYLASSYFDPIFLQLLHFTEQNFFFSSLFKRVDGKSSLVREVNWRSHLTSSLKSKRSWSQTRVLKRLADRSRMNNLVTVAFIPPREILTPRLFEKKKKHLCKEKEDCQKHVNIQSVRQVYCL